MTTTNDQTTKAQALRDAELRLESDLAAAKTDLAAARERESDTALTAALAGGGGRKTGETAASIVERITAITAAINEARTRRMDAIRATWAAESAQKRAEAAKVQKTADEHTKRAQELLAALEAHENAPFVPEVRLLELKVNWGRLSDAVAVPRSETLRAEVAALERQAAAIDGRTVQTNGGVTTATREELLDAIRAWDAMKIAPTLHSLIAWLDAHERELRAKLNGLAPHVAANKRVAWRFQLAWRDGEIDAKASKIDCELIEPVRLIGTDKMGERRIPVDRLVSGQLVA